MLFRSGQAFATANPVDQRAAELAQILNQKRSVESFFSPSFLAEIPASQIESIARALIAANGAVTGVEAVASPDSRSGMIDIGYERAVVRFELALADNKPFRVIGLRMMSSQTRGDSPQKLIAEFAQLPGVASLLVTKLNMPVPTSQFEYRADDQRAVASSFKLWVLAEAARQVAAGVRSWSDVVPLGPRSLPSGITQNWPAGAPMTLHSLAVLMISISDNSAADTLLLALGRDKVDAVVTLTGHSQSAKTLPLLTTIEAFALKMPLNASLRTRLITMNVGEKAALLKQNAGRLVQASIDSRQFANGPLLIDTIEWFASAHDMAATLDWLRRNGGETARAILAINPGATPGVAARFDYIGFKGGSEAGVIAANYLIRTKSGDWYGVTGSWNNAAALVDEPRFDTLMQRALGLIRP